MKDRNRRQTPAEFSSRLERCRVCRQGVSLLFEARILNKHQVAYGRCPACGLIQTEYPHWFSEAYGRTITVQDVGLVRRNLRMHDAIQDLILDHFNPDKRFLDYSGGHGLLVRLLRDSGFDFYRHDPLCADVFAGAFDIPELNNDDCFEMITACELFEHLPEPRDMLRRLFAHADSVFLTTELLPATTPQTVDEWWYFFPENGQHVTFYSLKALHVLAEEVGARLYSDGERMHLLTMRRLAWEPFQKSTFLLRRLDRMLGRWRASLRKVMYAAPPRPSLLPQDAQKARGKTPLPADHPAALRGTKP